MIFKGFSSKAVAAPRRFGQTQLEGFNPQYICKKLSTKICYRSRGRAKAQQCVEADNWAEAPLPAPLAVITPGFRARSICCARAFASTRFSPGRAPFSAMTFR